MTVQQKDIPAQPHSRTIAEWAYQIYLREGCPNGRELDHWLEAEAHMQQITGRPVQKNNGHKKNGNRPARRFEEFAGSAASRTPAGPF